MLRTIALAAAVIAVGCAGLRDPVSHDPALRGAPPALLWDGGFESAGQRLNALVYEAAGPGPHPTLLLLHGYPGNERNLDLAQALRRAGWNVVYFHYRGAWGSGGRFTFGGSLEDVGAVLSQVRAPEFAAEHRVDPERVVLVGHSMGGFLALIAGAEQPAARCAVSLAGADLGRYGAAAADPAVAAQVAGRFDLWGKGRLAGVDGSALLDEIVAQGDRFQLLTHAPELAAKPVLLVAGLRDEVVAPDEMAEPMLAALQEAGAEHAELVVLDADHSFTARRIALARALVGFLDRECR